MDIKICDFFSFLTWDNLADFSHPGCNTNGNFVEYTMRTLPHFINFTHHFLMKIDFLKHSWSFYDIDNISLLLSPLKFYIIEMLLSTSPLIDCIWAARGGELNYGQQLLGTQAIQVLNLQFFYCPNLKYLLYQLIKHLG